MRARSVFICVAGWALMLALLCFVSYRYGVKQGRSETITVRVDTLTVCDTVVREKPVFVRSYIRDTVRVMSCDTQWVELPREVRVYEDSSYRAVVSGAIPSLDSIRVYRTTSFVTRTEVQTIRQWRHFTYGVQLGFGGTYGLIGGRFDIGPYLGVGIGWNF